MPGFDDLAGFPTQPTWLRIPVAGPSRPVTGAEIAQLESQGCTADDWAGLLVPDDFNPGRVARVHIAGKVVLGRFYKSLDRAGAPVRSGVYDAYLTDCVIGDDAHVSRVGFMAGVVVGSEAIVAECSEILGRPESTFGNGARVGLQTANANRAIPVVADLLFDHLAVLVRPRPESEVLEALEDLVSAYVKACRIGKTVIAPGARVTGCHRVSGSYIDAGCIVSGATTLADSTLLSGGGDASRVGSGAIVRNSLLQWNAVADDGAFVENALLCEASTVTRHGIVTASAIGPNTTIAEGEVNASVVGPFTGFNHQALLVSACWPEGRGNVGYGANVGSNHTGRAPDQEVHPGEGAFFGLGLNVKMPADFSAAPYTVVATGVNTAPQRLAMPFSLIVPGATPDGPNRLIPGWGLSRNMYGIMRNIWKFTSRNRARRSAMDPDAFRPEILALIRRAYDQLVAAPSLPQYSGADISGLGATTVKRRDLEEGIDAYRRTLRWYGLREYMRMWDAMGRPPLPSAVPYLDDFVTATDPDMLLELYLAAERERLAAVLTSKARDDSRGSKTIEDYVQVHTPAADDPLYLWAQDRYESIAGQVADLRARA